ncbi:MAG: DUF1673 domain-containing protein [ANME-2 cluster archaeon]|nr:DUF1673 domain-containing protein [ANME-2 cluster archaeon]
MTLDFGQTIRKMMGWCPQKGFDLADTRREKHGLYGEKFHEMAPHAVKGITPGEKLIIDYLEFNVVSIGIILFSIVMAIIILFISAFFVPILRNFVRIIFSIGFLFVIFLLMYAKRKNAELTADSIIVNRPFHKPVVIPKDNILKTEVVRNYNHLVRWIIPLLVLFWLAFSMTHITEVSSQYFAGNYSLLDASSTVLLNIGVISAYISIYFMGKKKSTYRNALKITAKLKNEVSLHVYVDNPQKLKNKLEVNH